MIVDLSVPYSVTYLRRGSSRVRQGVVSAHMPVDIPEAETEPLLAVAIKSRGVDHYWCTIGGALYRYDPLPLPARLAEPVAPLPTVPAGTPSPDDIGLSWQARQVVSTDEEGAHARVAAGVAGLRVHGGRLYYPSNGPLLRIDPVEDGRVRALYRTYELVPLDGFEPSPSSYPGRVFGIDEMVRAAEFGNMMGYSFTEAPMVTIKDASLCHGPGLDRPLLDAAARLFDPENNNRALRNLPFEYVEGYLAYHRPEFARDVVTDELVSILQSVVGAPGYSKYINAVRKRYLDMLDDVGCALWRRGENPALTETTGPLFA